MPPLHILFADDHGLFRKGVIAALKNLKPTWKFSEADNGKEALAMINSNNCPDVVLLDVAMPVMDGVETVRNVRQTHLGLPIIVISQFDERSLILYLLQLGINSYLSKDTDPENVVEAVEAVLLSGRYLTDNMRRVLEESIGTRTQRKIQYDLSNRDKEIIHFLRQGKSSKEIASQMHLTETSIESYRKDLLHKTQTRNVAELISFAHRVGLLL